MSLKHVSEPRDRPRRPRAPQRVWGSITVGLSLELGFEFGPGIGLGLASGFSRVDVQCRKVDRKVLCCASLPTTRWGGIVYWRYLRTNCVPGSISALSICTHVKQSANTTETVNLLCCQRYVVDMYISILPVPSILLW